MSSGSTGVRTFWALTGLLFVLRLLLGFLTLPQGLATALSLVLTVVFLGLPIVAVFRAAEQPWQARLAASYTLLGAVAHAAGGVSLAVLLPPSGVVTVAVQALVQAAIAVWTLGLGAWVAILVKDKNLILPVALFLAGLDVFLVFNPDAPTSKIVRSAPQVFQSMAVAIPTVRAEAPEAPTGARVVPQAYVGPADLLFIAAFFVMLRRHQMRVRETVLWLVPVMVAYLFLVLAPIGLAMLPALVPIGLTVLTVNRDQFTMSRGEKGMAWGVAVLSAALAAWGLMAHFTQAPTRPLAEPLTSEGGPGVQGQGATLPPTGGSPRR